MVQITEHFKSEDFACHDGTPYPPNWIDIRLKPLCVELERIRALTNQPMKIDSGYRTITYNEAIYRKMGKPATKSCHCEGIAADIKLQGMTPVELHAAIENLIAQKAIPDGGLGLYPTFVHYDLRCTITNKPPARWRG